MKTGIKAGDAMTRLPVLVSPKSSIKECAILMKDKRVGSLIISENQAIRGIVTESDMVRKALAMGLDPEQAKISDIMVEEVITIKPEHDIFDAIHVMKDNDIKHLPVSDAKKLLGLLTLKDILKIQPQLFDLLVDKISIAEEEAKMSNIMKPREGICQGCGNYDEELMSMKGMMLCEVCREDTK